MGRFHLLTVVVASLATGNLERVLRTIREHYADFGPTVRQLMTPTGLGNPGKLRPRVHQSRLRRACTTERIQIDVCGHHGIPSSRT